MSKIIHAQAPLVFPDFCACCMTSSFSWKDYSETLGGHPINFTVQLQIPVCDECLHASKTFKIATMAFIATLALSIGTAAALYKVYPGLFDTLLPVMLLSVFAAGISRLLEKRARPLRLYVDKCDKNNIRFKFRNNEYAERFLELNPGRSRVINLWKFE